MASLGVAIQPRQDVVLKLKGFKNLHLLAVSYGINGCQGLSHFIINGKMKPLRGGTMMGSHN